MVGGNLAGVRLSKTSTYIIIRNLEVRKDREKQTKDRNSWKSFMETRLAHTCVQSR